MNVIRVTTFKIGHLEIGYWPLVKLPKGDVPAVGRPVPGLRLAEFFFVHPVVMPVKGTQVAGFIQGELFFLRGSKVINKHIAFALNTHL